MSGRRVLVAGFIATSLATIPVMALTTMSSSADSTGPAATATTAPSSPPDDATSPYGEAPSSEQPQPSGGSSADQLKAAQDYVAADPTSRALCRLADGTMTVIVARRVPPIVGPMVPPASAGCVGGK